MSGFYLTLNIVDLNRLTVISRGLGTSLNFAPEMSALTTLS